MKCRKCGYPLWNLRQPRCPECGNGFNPMDWEFSEGSVRFLCPHCEEALSDNPARSTWTLCPHCKRKFLWRAVTVEPVDPDPVNARFRSTPLRLSPWTGAIILVVTAVCGGALFLPALAGRPQPPAFGAYALGFIIAAVLCAIGVGFSPRRERRQAYAVYGVLLATWTGLQIARYVETARDYASSRWCVTTVMTLRSIPQVQEHSIDSTGGLPGTYAAFIHPDADFLLPADFFLTWESGLDSDDMTVGPYAIDEIQSGSVTLAQLENAMAGDRERSEWERIGDFVLSHDVQGLRAGDPELIVGISVTSPHGGGRFVLYADGHCEARSSADQSWINTQNAYRAERGLEPLPTLP